MILLIMGVSGSGKTTLGRLLASRLNCSFLEGDDFHCAENIKKMTAGTPLTDKDRTPWLKRISFAVQQKNIKNQSCVVGCSALKRRYRQVILSNIDQYQLIYLKGQMQKISARMKARSHFMPIELLKSQFDTLEPPLPEENALIIDVSVEVEECLDHILKQLKFP